MKRVQTIVNQVVGESVTFERERYKHTFNYDTVTLLGAPFCDGQNLEGVDLAPKEMRRAGLQIAIEKLGLKFFDAGDIDFKGNQEKLGLMQSDKRTTVQEYVEWLKDGQKQKLDNFLAEHKSGSEDHSPKAPGARSSSNDSAHDKAWDDETIKNREPGAPVDPYDAIVNCDLIGASVKQVYDHAKEIVDRGDFLLTVGGDHSIASGSITAVANKHPDLAVIWIDAHADANTPETSPSGHYHGMPAAHVMGWFQKQPRGFEWFPDNAPVIQESRLAYIGLRDIDRGEAELLRKSGVHIYTMRDVDRLGIAATIADAVRRIDPNMNRPIHLSLDVDGIDPAFAPGTGTMSRGGLSYREVHYICEELAYTKRLVSMDLVEVNPMLDDTEAGQRDMHGDDPDIQPAGKTVRLGLELCLSAMGKSILYHRLGST